MVDNKESVKTQKAPVRPWRITPASAPLVEPPTEPTEPEPEPDPETKDN